MGKKMNIKRYYFYPDYSSYDWFRNGSRWRLDSVVNKKFCIVGEGPIGRRHANIFKKLNCNNFFYKRRKTLKKNITNNEFNKFKTSIDLICICNPTALHFKTFKQLQKYSKNFFIEKPISHKLKEVKKLEKIVKKNKIKIFNGYMLRFDPRIIYKKNYQKKSIKMYFIWKHIYLISILEKL